MKHLHDTITPGNTYTVKDHQFPGVMNKFTGIYTGITGDLAIFTTEAGYNVTFNARDLTDAIEYGEITIISEEARPGLTQFNTRLPEYTHELIDLIADTTGMTKTQIIIAAIEAYAVKVQQDHAIS